MTEIDDLDWYFGGDCEAELGCRSAQGGIEATLHLRALCSPPGPGDMHLRETFCGRSYDAESARRTLAAERSRAIRARLDRLKPYQRRVLELHHGDAARADGVSLALLCSMAPARRSYSIASKHGEVDTIRTFITWLVVRARTSGGPHAELWGMILGRAKGRLESARRAYDAA